MLQPESRHCRSSAVLAATLADVLAIAGPSRSRCSLRRFLQSTRLERFCRDGRARSRRKNKTGGTCHDSGRLRKLAESGSTSAVKVSAGRISKAGRRAASTDNCCESQPREKRRAAQTSFIRAELSRATRLPRCCWGRFFEETVQTTRRWRSIHGWRRNAGLASGAVIGDVSLQ